MREYARKAIRLCRELAEFSEEEERLTRTFLSPPMSDVHRVMQTQMMDAGMRTFVDAAGNLHGLAMGRPGAPRLLIGSHLDTVRDAGAFDGVLGVVLGTLLVDVFRSRQRALDIEVIGFSEEEGVRFGKPFIGSRALVGTLADTDLDTCDSNGRSVREAIQHFGLEPNEIPQARLGHATVGYLELHIEQGPLLESLDFPIGIVNAIAGQSRLDFVFSGDANHAGTTPMNLRTDALAGAAEWILRVEETGKTTDGLVATVGLLEAAPNVTNVIAGRVRVSLDVRHACDEIRRQAVERLVLGAESCAERRGLELKIHQRFDQAAVRMDETMCNGLEKAVQALGYPVHRMASGAGHDAMIVAPFVPSAMLFIRTPGGVSHSPEESVREDDVEAALVVGLRFLENLESQYA